MSTKKGIVLIPHWIVGIMERNKLALVDCLDYVKIKDLISLKDQVLFASLARESEMIFGERLYCSPMTSIWYDSIPDGYKPLRDFVINELSPIAFSDTFKSELCERLFTNHPGFKNGQEKPFITYDLTPEYTGVVIYPGYFMDKHDHRLQIEVVRSVLKVLYAYSSYHEVAKQPLFKRYLELLAMTK